MPQKRKSGYDGLGGNSFGEDVDRGLGTNTSDNSTFRGAGGNSFGEDMDTGLGKKPQQKKQSGRKNIMDEWTDAAGGGW